MGAVMAGEEQNELAEAIRQHLAPWWAKGAARSNAVTSSPTMVALETVDALLANPELVLRALGCAYDADQRMWWYHVDPIMCAACQHPSHNGSCLASNGRSVDGDGPFGIGSGPRHPLDMD